jgi:cobalt-zinc-cadmium efflux system protein
MWVVASIGLAGNLTIGLGLGHGHDHGHGGDLNVRSAWLHVMGDAAASAGVLAAGALISWTGRLWWDPLVSAAIAVVIARGAWGIVERTIGALMEGTPQDTDVTAVAAAMAADAAVTSVHHVHVWALDGSRKAMSGHVVVDNVPVSDTEAVVARLGDRLREAFGIEHTTIQVESCDGPCPHGSCACERP